MTRARPRFPELKKDADGKNLCRGCHGPIPKGRLTWCSHECHKTYNPFYVKIAVKERSGEKCEKCGKDCSRAAQREYTKLCPQEPRYKEDCGLSYPWDAKAWYSHPLYLIHIEKRKAWEKAAPYPEFDHIIPHSEGGKFVLENIRLLCRACHKERTRQWHKERKLAKA